MYETGRGVPRDWHLAKRNYDLSMETNLEAQLPATLSLIGLYLRRYVFLFSVLFPPHFYTGLNRHPPPFSLFLIRL